MEGLSEKVTNILLGNTYQDSVLRSVLGAAAFLAPIAFPEIAPKTGDAASVTGGIIYFVVNAHIGLYRWLSDYSKEK